MVRTEKLEKGTNGNRRELEGGLVKMSSTFAIDINVRFYDFLQKKHFSFPSLPAAVLRCLYGWHSRQTIDISFYIYFLALAYLDLYFMFFLCPKNDLFRMCPEKSLQVC